MPRAALPGQIRFYKMSGSGNDFVFLNGLNGAPAALREPPTIAAVCDRRMGVGADGIVFLDPSSTHDFRMVYFNRDGSRAEFCGNAALCSTNLAIELGIGASSGLSFETDSGPVTGRIHADGQPEVDLSPVAGVDLDVALPLGAGETRAGLTVVGVPHAVVSSLSADEIDLEARGPILRHHPATRGGANVDFVSPGPSGSGSLRMRTFERGVEAETLACGSGAVASALIGSLWAGETRDEWETAVRTSSGLDLVVRVRRGPSGTYLPTLRGEGRVVFEGVLRAAQG